MQKKEKISKRKTLLLSIFMLVLVAAALTNYASAVALFQWHPLSEISADGGATSIATASGKLNSSIFEGPITTSLSGPVDISVDTNIAGMTTANGPIDLNGAVTVNNDMDLNSNKISNLANPTANTDAATKEYVDALSTTSGIINLKQKHTFGFDADCNWVPGGYYKYMAGNPISFPTTNKNDYMYHGAVFCNYASHSYCKSSGLSSPKSCHGITTYGVRGGGAASSYCYTLQCWTYW